MEWRQHLIALGVSGLCLLHTVRFDCSSSDFTLNHMIWPWCWPCRSSMVGSSPTRSWPMPWWAHWQASWRCFWLQLLRFRPWNGVQQQVSTCATPPNDRLMRGSLTRYTASTPPHYPSTCCLRGSRVCARWRSTEALGLFFKKKRAFAIGLLFECMWPKRWVVKCLSCLVHRTKRNYLSFEWYSEPHLTKCLPIR